MNSTICTKLPHLCKWRAARSSWHSCVDLLPQFYHWHSQKGFLSFCDLQVDLQVPSARSSGWSAILYFCWSFSHDTVHGTVNGGTWEALCQYKLQHVPIELHEGTGLIHSNLHSARVLALNRNFIRSKFDESTLQATYLPSDTSEILLPAK